MMEGDAKIIMVMFEKRALDRPSRKRMSADRN